MNQPAIVIPEKLFFKIGEVCELLGVQAHVLRYWESEFPMLAPQKNRAGQRVYRKRDVEMALRIKELLYEEQYTIAGAKKRLANDLRNGGRPQAVEPEGENASHAGFVNQPTPPLFEGSQHIGGRTVEERMALRRIASELHELLGLLEAGARASGSKVK
jgi:DNA-binding transcriptional MerR regulator